MHININVLYIMCIIIDVLTTLFLDDLCFKFDEQIVAIRPENVWQNVAFENYLLRT